MELAHIAYNFTGHDCCDCEKELLTTVVSNIARQRELHSICTLAYCKQETSKGVYSTVCRELLYCTENTHNTQLIIVYPVQYSAPPPEKLRSGVTTAMSMTTDGSTAPCVIVYTVLLALPC